MPGGGGGLGDHRRGERHRGRRVGGRGGGAGGELGRGRDQRAPLGTEGRDPVAVTGSLGRVEVTVEGSQAGRQIGERPAGGFMVGVGHRCGRGPARSPGEFVGIGGQQVECRGAMDGGRVRLPAALTPGRLASGRRPGTQPQAPSPPSPAATPARAAPLSVPPGAAAPMTGAAP